MQRLKRIDLQAQIIQQIVQYIQKHGLKSGDPLPSQMQMTRTFGVSRSTIREAVKVLEHDQVVEVVNGKGIFVRDVAMAQLRREMVILRKAADLNEILEARRLIEREILLQAVQRAEESDLEAIRNTYDRFFRNYGISKNRDPITRELFLEKHDTAFHDAVYAACHNRILIMMIHYLTRFFRREWHSLIDCGRKFPDLMQAHTELYEALQRRDAAGAIRANERSITMEMKGGE
jgi:DNA-binding FadR family transcriptional regulator